MSSSDEDEDLKRAIALSLQDESHSGPVSNTLAEAIQLESETEDEEDPADAEALQRETHKDANDLHASTDNTPRTRAVVSKTASGTANSLNFLGIDRKKMEQERLARKRRASISPPPPRKILKTLSNQPSQPPSPSKPAAEKSHVRPLSQAPPGCNNPVPTSFPRGAVKKTWAFGHPRTGDDIKLEEVLQKDDLNLAVLSSFQWDVEWLLAKINTKSMLHGTQITLVMQAKDDATKKQYKRETASMSNLRLCFPSMEGQVNCMHSKLMLLSHPGYLRVAVPTANLVNYDWGEAGDMENTVFLIDLPRVPGSRSNQELTFFGRELIYFLESMGLEPSIIASVYNFDFSATKDFAFVHTIGGAHVGKGDPWRRTGYCGLGRAIGELGLATDKPLQMDFVTSSVGSLNIEFLTTLYSAAHGDDGSTEYQWRKEVTKVRSKGAKDGITEAESHMIIRDEARNNFRIYFPTQETVKRSKAGSAGTICLQSKWYNSPTFPRGAMRDCKSTRTGLLMHNKILYVRSRDEITLKSYSCPTSWAYVGSANCSESAWGRLSKDRITKTPKLNCRNWECGVVVPVRGDGGRGGQGDLSEFEGTVPVPMQYPGETYGSRKPWYFLEQ